MTTRAPWSLLVSTLASAWVACRDPQWPTRPAEQGWNTLTWEERHDVMTFAVLPNMARTFQRFEGTAAPEMTCATCHGVDAEAAGYSMPRSLPPLDPARMPNSGASDPKEARMAKFMTDEVTPAMADLLGLPRYDPQTKRGFSCFSCHPSR
jgi:hypothetical protein